MAKMTGAQAVVEAFTKENVEYVFGLPGGACLPLFDALYDAKFKVILVRHEQGAVGAIEVGRLVVKGHTLEVCKELRETL